MMTAVYCTISFLIGLVVGATAYSIEDDKKKKDSCKCAHENCTCEPSPSKTYSNKDKYYICPVCHDARRYAYMTCDYPGCPDGRNPQ